MRATGPRAASRRAIVERRLSRQAWRLFAPRPRLSVSRLSVSLLSVSRLSVSRISAPRLSPLLSLIAVWAAFGSTGPAQAATARELVETAIRYEHAEGYPRDYPKAHTLYCSAARMNDADAYLRMGWMYANGRGLPRDDAIANTLFRRAAKLGNEMAGRLANMVHAGSDTDKLPDCLKPRPAGTAALRVDTTATPIVDDPARFLPLPTAAARRELVQAVVRMSREFALDPRLVFAVMRAESGFDPLARSSRNAQGLMQLIPETAERFAVRNAYDPLENVRGGMRYLRWLLSYFRGDVVLALAGYNAGEGAVDRHRGVPPYAETLAYVQRIRALYPHDHHPFDSRLVAPSSWVSETRKTALDSHGGVMSR